MGKMDENHLARQSVHVVKTQAVVPVQVNIHEAKTHLSKLIRYALEGEEVVIARGTAPWFAWRSSPVRGSSLVSAPSGD